MICRTIQTTHTCPRRFRWRPHAWPCHLTVSFYCHFTVFLLLKNPCPSCSSGLGSSVENSGTSPIFSFIFFSFLFPYERTEFKERYSSEWNVVTAPTATRFFSSDGSDRSSYRNSQCIAAMSCTYGSHSSATRWVCGGCDATRSYGTEEATVSLSGTWSAVSGFYCSSSMASKTPSLSTRACYEKSVLGGSLTAESRRASTGFSRHCFSTGGSSTGSGWS